MQQQLISHSADLKRLQDEGYSIRIASGYIIVDDIPYVNASGKICDGSLAAPYTMQGEKVAKPIDHVIKFKGDSPCNKGGSPIVQIKYLDKDEQILPDFCINHSFSNKPPEGFDNFYTKFLNYINIISSPAMSLDKTVTPCCFKPILPEASDDVFCYDDTNSSRSDFSDVSLKLRNQKIGIIGLGGTGAYILDFVAKTPVTEIHLFDGDQFYAHNAFRSPIPPTIEQLKEKTFKTDYYEHAYSKMHKNIISHTEYVSKGNLSLLDNMTFVFIAVDNGKDKKCIVEHLLAKSIPFIDSGMGLIKGGSEILGQIRMTFIGNSNTALAEKSIPFADTDDDPYTSNIQIAELNALAASFSVIKWKMSLGFYQDQTDSSEQVYVLNTGALINDKKNNT